jgi:hypothetical protein
VEAGRLLLDMDLYRQEVLMDETGDCRVRIYFGIQPSACTSNRRGTEVQQYGLI